MSCSVSDNVFHHNHSIINVLPDMLDYIVEESIPNLKTQDNKNAFNNASRADFLGHLLEKSISSDLLA